MTFQFAAFLRDNGEVIVARQFSGMLRDDVLELSALFFHMYVQSKRQTLSFEDKSYRCILRKTDEVVFILCSLKPDNILHSLEAMQLLTNVCRHVCPEMTEQIIEQNAFDLLMAIDEVIFDGRVRCVSLEEVKENLAMESKNEKLTDMDTQGKERLAIATGQEKAKAFKQKKREAMLDIDKPFQVNSSRHEISLDSLKMIDTSSHTASALPIETIDDILLREKKLTSTLGEKSQARKPPVASTGELNILLVETISVEILAKGGQRNFRLDGVLRFQADDFTFDGHDVRMRGVDEDLLDFKVSAEMNKDRFYRDHILTPKMRGFSLRDETVDVLRWSVKQGETAFPLPVSVALWPRRRSTLLELQTTDKCPLAALRVRIPYREIEVTSAHSEVGECVIDEKARCIHWTVPCDASGLEGVMRIDFDGDFIDSNLLPVQIEFQGKQTISGVMPDIDPGKIGNRQSPFECSVVLRSGEYQLC
ncbi:Coatomer subunit delta [Perkinsela sp. CCAP 1560/4]|nr:Coatomer subunit delta [Perkinsela sp. CCAP 1560/4]|eukprot:KNH08024.1 Coatomer subunit delta [Perkinsela sp. CCAP 1560/4]